MNGIDAGAWADVALKIGLGGAVILVLAIGVAVGFATRGPEFVNALNGIVSTILEHRRENRRIKAENERERDRLAQEFKSKGIERLEAPQDLNP